MNGPSFPTLTRGSIPASPLRPPLTPTSASAHPATPLAWERKLPLLARILYSAFMAVLVPVYWYQYGPSNFLYFCDVALFLTLIGLWTESRLLLSMSAVGILLPQALWCADFAAHLVGWKVTGMTDYMFDAQRSLFLRGLSLFHGWLPFLLVYAVRKIGYDARAWAGWTAVAWGLCLVCFFAFPPAGPEFAGRLTPNNINYVWGFDDAQAQTWMSSHAYLVTWMSALFLLAYTPTHFLLRRFFGTPKLDFSMRRPSPTPTT